MVALDRFTAETKNVCVTRSGLDPNTSELQIRRFADCAIVTRLDN